MTHPMWEIASAGQRLCLLSFQTALSAGRSFITPWMDASTPNRTMIETIVRYVHKEITVDREELIERVTQATAGNRHDYLTRGDVAQIVDATLQVMSGAVDA